VESRNRLVDLRLILQTIATFNLGRRLSSNARRPTSSSTSIVQLLTLHLGTNNNETHSSIFSHAQCRTA
jgi:hypothetical protein